MVMIAKKLDINSLLNVNWVSKRWNDIVNDSEVWKYVDCRDLFIFDEDLFDKLCQSEGSTSV